MTDPPDLQGIKAMGPYQSLMKRLAEPEWRLDNLYWIRDDQGERIRFVRNETQRELYRAMSLRSVIPKARKLGLSTFIAILICDRCVFRSGHIAGIVDQSLDDATDKLSIIRFAFENMPKDIRDANPLVRDNDELLEWRNGSSVSVGTSYRGGTPADLLVSEYGKISAVNPEAAKEIKTGAIQAVPATGRVFVESTAHGTSGEFCDMVRRAERQSLQKTPMTALDFKLHFFGWWMKREYRLPNNLVIVSHDLKKYFATVEAKHGIKLDADQQAWYAKKHEELGPDDVKQEFPTTIEELFFVSLEGAYFREEISRARRDGRIGQMVPFDPTRRVNTFWDIGEDCTSIWFHQTDGLRHRMIDYWEEIGSSLQTACGVIDQKRRDRGFVYDKHYGPHDLENRDWAHESKTRKDAALALGVKFEVVPRIAVKADSIEAARRFIGLAWFDQEYCGLGVERLENYRKRWNKQMAHFEADPMHDHPESDAADALQQGAMGLKPERVKDDSNKFRRERPRGVSQWGA